MRDRPTPEELLKGARAVLERDITPNLKGGQRFAAILISRAMAVAARALANGDESLRVEADRLADILHSEKSEKSGQALHTEVSAINRQLVERIRSGEFDAGAHRRQLFDHLCQVTRDKLAESNPKYFEQGTSQKAENKRRPEHGREKT
jgi:hypothetical protein